MRRSALRYSVRLVAALGLPAAGGGLPVGCASQERIDADPLVVTRQLQAAGFKGRAVIVFGGGHVGGLSYNVTGSSGFIEVEINPRPADEGP